MTITTLTSRQFNQDASKAKKAAQFGPVVITDRGRPAHVLMTFAQYRQFTGKRESIVDMLASPEDEAAIDFDPPRSNFKSVPADFS